MNNFLKNSRIWIYRNYDKLNIILNNKLIFFLGISIFIICSLYVIYFVKENWNNLYGIRFINPELLVVSVVVYIACQICTALTWPIILRALRCPISILSGIQIGLAAQVGKYLPGNVAHYAGRAALARAAGVSITESGVSTGIELISAVIAGASVSLIALPFDSGQFRGIMSSAAILVLGVAIAVAAAWVTRKKYSFLALAMPTVCLIISFVLVGISLFCVIESLGFEVADPASVISIFAAAWVLGFVIPGAPAGIGVREAVLIGFLTPLFGAGPAIAISLLHRVITALVDVFLGAVAFIMMIANRKEAG